MDDDDRGNFCEACNYHDGNELDHKQSIKHRFNFVLWEFKNYRKALVKDRHGIEFKASLQQTDNRYIILDYRKNKGKYTVKVSEEQLTLHKNTITFACRIVNTTKKKIHVSSISLLHPIDIFQLRHRTSDINSNIFLIESKAELQFEIVFCTKDLIPGSYKNSIKCNIITADHATEFIITRSIVVEVLSDVGKDEAHHKSPFTGQPWKDINRYVPCTIEPKFTFRYEVPKEYARILKHGLMTFQDMTEIEQKDLFKIMRLLGEDKRVTIGNYKDYWPIILWMEEIAQKIMLRQYNMEKVSLGLKYSRVLELEVPGLAEKRPSVIVGDTIHIRLCDDHTVYKGIVTSVNDKTVDISNVSDELVSYVSDQIENELDFEVDVRFTLNRLSFERMHEAVDKICKSDMVKNLFYSMGQKPNHQRKAKKTAQRTLHSADFFNKQVETNPEQREAVIQILYSTIASPYIVFGPPGTGKTITIVEAILQIKKRTNKRILVCAPANAACDMITLKLIPHCTKKELIRIHSVSRDRLTVTDELLAYSNVDEDGQFEKTTAVDTLSTFRIVVTTLVLCGRYSGRGYSPDCVFIDEAAQASEPESAIPLSLLKPGKQVVLAGDPKQLGPIVLSKCSKSFGLEISLLERLMENDLYKSYNSEFITMLKLNFRSHADILHIPNKLFYNRSLEAVSEYARRDPIVNIAIYPKVDARKWAMNQRAIPQGNAIEFCGVSSKEKREGSSPSYFNPAEIKAVINYIKTLTNLTKLALEDRVTHDQIGVVTPYKRQVYKIREALDNNKFEDVEVGTTETFQGREKRVIIISTVRAQHNLLSHDRKYRLGFVSSDQRFNVAVTRAMSKLIVIGCPQVLGTDHKWLDYMNKCTGYKTYFGVEYMPRTDDLKQKIIGNFKNFKSEDQVRKVQA